MMLSSLLYVDDVIDITATLLDRLDAHEQVLLFTKLNNLSLSGTKCYGMAMNTDITPPTLTIDDLKEVLPAEVIIYLEIHLMKKETMMTLSKTGYGEERRRPIALLR